jgi:hypothetical protein
MDSAGNGNTASKIKGGERQEKGSLDEGQGGDIALNLTSPLT